MSSPSIVHSCSRRSALGIVGLALVMPSVSAFAQTPAILVHKDPDCGCCASWVRHLEDAGFAVTFNPSRNGWGCQPISRLATPLRSMDTCWRDMSRRRPSDDSWKSDRPRSDWPSPACPPGHQEWRAVYLSGMTSFSSVRIADNPLCTLLARKMSAEALGLRINPQQQRWLILRNCFRH